VLVVVSELGLVTLALVPFALRAEAKRELDEIALRLVFLLGHGVPVL
jgi:hypothetical protein